MAGWTGSLVLIAIATMPLVIGIIVVVSSHSPEPEQ